MCPKPDWEFQRGRFLLRRWGRWVRFNWLKSDVTFGFNLPRGWVRNA